MNVQLKSDIVYQAIRARIEEGFWKPGQQIFSERQLSELFSVSRVTVRHAITQLVGEGHLAYREGRLGTFVSEQAVPEQPGGSKPFIGIAIDNYTPAFASFLLEGIHDALWKQNFHTLYCNTHFGDDSVVEKLRSFIQQGAKGLIFSPLLGEKSREINEAVFSLAKEAGIPLVQLDRYVEGKAYSRVQCDNTEAMYRLCKRLLQMGKKSPLVLTGISTSSTEERLEGIRKAFAEHHIVPTVWQVDEQDYFEHESVKVVQHTQRELEAFDVVIGVTQVLSKAAGRLVKTYNSDAVTAGISASVVEVPNEYAVIQPLYHIGYSSALLLVQQLEKPDLPCTSVLVRASQWPPEES